MNGRDLVIIIVACLFLMELLPAAGTLSENNYKKLQSIHKLIEQHQLDKAKNQLQQFLQSKHGAYTQALFLQTAAHVAIEQEQYQKAINYLKQAHELNALPEFVTNNIRYNLAQLYAQNDDWNNSLAMLKQWLSGNNKISPEQHIFAASVFAQKKHYQSAVKHVRQAIKSDPKPKESWYQLLVSLYLEQKKYRQAIPVYQTLIKRYAKKKNYWKQLSELYLQIQNRQKALAVLALANQQGLLTTEQEILRLVNLYLYADIPILAARLLQQKLDSGVVPASVKNRRKLADTWILAQEYSKAIAVLTVLAKQKPDNGQYLFQIGQLNMELAHWSRALQAFQLAEKKSKLDQGHNLLLMGISAYYAKKTDIARQAFERAGKYKKYTGQANGWLESLY